MNVEVENNMKVIVADDEALARKAIVSMLLRSDLPIEIVGEFDSGTHVMEYLKKTDGNADILITDIRMIDIDGLQTARYISEMGYRTQVILVSGYAEFSYAKQAIKYQVKEYLTKPIQQIDLLEAVNNIICSKRDQEIHKKHQKEQDILEFSKQQLSVRQLLYNDRLLYRLIESVSENNIWRKYRLVVIQINTNSEECQKMMCDLLDKWRTFHVVQIVNWYFPIGHEWLMVLSDRYKALAEKEVKILLNSIMLYIGSRVPFQISVGVSDIMESKMRFVAAYKNCVDAINLRLLKGWNTVYFYAESEKDSSVLFTEGQILGLKKELQKYNSGRVEEIVHTFFTDKHIKKLKSLEPVYKGIINMLSAISILHTEDERTWGITENLEQEQRYTLYQFYSIYELEYFMTERLEACMNRPIGENDTTDVMEIVIKYMQRNYQQQISLQELAEKQLFMNASYLSRLFKSTTGQTFSQYLLKIRLNAASDLLKNNNLQINEISEYVGFSDPSYFISCFKKQFYMTPKEFRRSFCERTESTLNA